MDLLELIRTRRSIRRYKSDEVREEDLQKILEAIRWAPSWANFQCWEIVIVRDMETKRKLGETVPKVNPASKAFVEAPVLLVVCSRMRVSGFYKEQALTKFGDWFMYDLGLATQNACLMAHALGLGTLIVGLFDHQKVKEIIGLPENCEAVTILPVGYPAAESTAPKRKEIHEFTYHDRFSEKAKMP